MAGGRWGDRLSGAQDAARRGAAEAQRRLEVARGRSPLVARGFAVAERDRRRLGGLLAGAVAYRLFLWLLPFALATVGLLGALTSLDENAVSEIGDNVGLQKVLIQAVADGARESGWWIALFLGLFGCLYAGIGAVRALRISHAAAWGIVPERMTKPVHASAVLLGLATALIVATELVAFVRVRTGVLGLICALAMIFVYFIVWLRISVWLPHRPVPVRALVPGAVLVAVGLQGLHLFTVYYLSAKAEHATSLYGTIGAALTLLLWLYIVARLTVGAAVLNAELARRPSEHTAPDEETDD